MPTNRSNDFGTQSLNERGLIFSIRYYAIIVFLINTSCTLLQVKYQTQDVTPFETHYVIMLAFFLIIYAHAVILVAEIKLRTHNSSYHVILGKISLLIGGLASILPLLILVPVVGWFYMLIWAICVVKVGQHSCQEYCLFLYRLILQASDLLMKILLKRRLLEQQNQLPV